MKIRAFPRLFRHLHSDTNLFEQLETKLRWIMLIKVKSIKVFLKFSNCHRRGLVEDWTSLCGEKNLFTAASPPVTSRFSNVTSAPKRLNPPPPERPSLGSRKRASKHMAPVFCLTTSPCLGSEIPCAMLAMSSRSRFISNSCALSNYFTRSRCCGNGDRTIANDDEWDAMTIKRSYRSDCLLACANGFVVRSTRVCSWHWRECEWRAETSQEGENCFVCFSANSQTFVMVLAFLD